MGLLPEIRRAWVTVDNQLYLWNYETGDVCLYDALDQVIVAVGLVAPRPGVFRERIKVRGARGRRPGRRSSQSPHRCTARGRSTCWS